jgi:hypothetical protein
MSAVACYGGQAGWGGAGRMLYRMSPADNDVTKYTASSKDHVEADSGLMAAFVTRITSGILY